MLGPQHFCARAFISCRGASKQVYDGQGDRTEARGSSTGTAALEGLADLSRTGAGEQDLASVYFDTPKHKLGRNGISLRIRRNGEKRLQTVKSQCADGSFRRGEWENEITGDVPDLRKVQGTALEPLLTKKLK